VDYSHEIRFVGSINDLQLVRPAEHKNLGLSATLVAPPEYNHLMAEAMFDLSELHKTYDIEIKFTPIQEDEQM